MSAIRIPLLVVLGLALTSGSAMAEGNDAGAAEAAGAGTAASAISEDDSESADGESATAEKATTIEGASRRKTIQISGYVQPQFGMRYRPGAVPRDRTDYSAESTRAGVILAGEPVDKVSYQLHLSVAATVLDAGDNSNNNNEDGQGDGVTGLFVERAAVDWDPTPHVGVSVGQMRIPFSVEGQISNTDLMFPNRAAANEVFLQGSDLGVLGRLAVRDSKLRVSAGVFNGTNPTTAAERDARGPLYSIRADIDPMGPMENGGRDTTGGVARFGFGAGVVYYPSTTYDDAGFAGPKMRDLRAALSVRAAFRRVYLQAEAMRRQRTDSLSSRPVIATGGYGQGSYYIPLKKGMAVSPIARIGWTVEDKSFDPRETLWTEAGATLHLRAPDEIRADDMQLTLQYLGERRITERESAHGLLAQLRLRW